MQIPRIAFDVGQKDSTYLNGFRWILRDHPAQGGHTESQIRSGFCGQPEQGTCQGLRLTHQLWINLFLRVHVGLRDLEVREGHGFPNLPTSNDLLLIFVLGQVVSISSTTESEMRAVAVATCRFASYFWISWLVFLCAFHVF